MNRPVSHTSKLLLLGLLCVMTLTGCNSWGGRTTVPGTVPLKVWVMLGPGEAIGGFGNSGCRLIAAQINRS
jgi:hypothetical protein